jgi:hypothetical protein
MRATKVKEMSHTRWTETKADKLPLAISNTYTSRGNAITKVLVKLVRCGWDGQVRQAFSVTSSTGRTIEWMPTSRALTSWDPKMVRSD